MVWLFEMLIKQEAQILLGMQALDLVKADLDGLAAGCGRVDALLAGTRSATAGLLAETDRNEKALAASEARSNLVERFLQQYQLSSTELDVLQVGSHQSDHIRFFYDCKSFQSCTNRRENFQCKSI